MKTLQMKTIRGCTVVHNSSDLLLKGAPTTFSSGLTFVLELILNYDFQAYLQHLHASDNAEVKKEFL